MCKSMREIIGEFFACFMRAPAFLLWLFCFLAWAPQALSAEMRDPTQPLGVEGGVAVESNVNRLQLHSILYAENRRLAVINGKVVLENQWIGNAKLLQVLPDHVVVELNGVRQKLVVSTPLRE